MSFTCSYQLWWPWLDCKVTTVVKVNQNILCFLLLFCKILICLVKLLHGYYVHGQDIHEMLLVTLVCSLEKNSKVFCTLAKALTPFRGHRSVCVILVCKCINVCARVHVCARVCASMRACVCVCVCVCYCISLCAVLMWVLFWWLCFTLMLCVVISVWCYVPSTIHSTCVLVILPFVTFCYVAF